MKEERIKTFIYCIVTPKDPIKFEIEWVESEWWSYSSVENWMIGLRLTSNMKKEEIMYLAAREAVKLRQETKRISQDGIDWNLLLSLMDSLEIPYNIPKKMEEGEPWNDDYIYSNAN